MAEGTAYYRDILKAPHAARLLTGTLIGRLPNATAPVAIVLFTRAEGGSYSLAAWARRRVRHSHRDRPAPPRSGGRPARAAPRPVPRRRRLGHRHGAAGRRRDRRAAARVRGRRGRGRVHTTARRRPAGPVAQRPRPRGPGAPGLRHGRRRPGSDVHRRPPAGDAARLALVGGSRPPRHQRHRRPRRALRRPLGALPRLALRTPRGPLAGRPALARAARAPRGPLLRRPRARLDHRGRNRVRGRPRSGVGVRLADGGTGPRRPHRRHGVRRAAVGRSPRAAGCVPSSPCSPSAICRSRSRPVSSP